MDWMIVNACGMTVGQYTEEEAMARAESSSGWWIAVKANSHCEALKKAKV